MVLFRLRGHPSTCRLLRSTSSARLSWGPIEAAARVGASRLDDHDRRTLRPASHERREVGVAVRLDPRTGGTRARSRGVAMIKLDEPVSHEQVQDWSLTALEGSAEGRLSHAASRARTHPADTRLREQGQRLTALHSAAEGLAG